MEKLPKAEGLIQTRIPKADPSTIVQATPKNFSAEQPKTSFEEFSATMPVKSTSESSKKDLDLPSFSLDTLTLSVQPSEAGTKNLTVDATPREQRSQLRSVVAALEHQTLVPNSSSVALPSSAAESAPSASAAPASADAPGTEKKAGNERIQETIDRVQPQREAMIAAQTAYLERYKDFYRQKGAEKGGEPEELKQLKSAYDESRALYGNALSQSAVERLKDRGVRVREGESMEDAVRRTVDRYNRLVRFNEVVKPASRAMNEARVEALGERPKNIFQKGLGWMRKQNDRLETWAGSKQKARVYRSAIAAIAITGGFAAAGAFATSGILAAAGFATFRFGRSLAAVVAGAAAGETAAQLYARLHGNKSVADAEKALEMVGRNQDLRESPNQQLTAAELDNLDESRLVLEKKADRMALERRKNLIRALTALGVGAGVSALLAENVSVDQMGGGAASKPEASVTGTGESATNSPEAGVAKAVPPSSSEASGVTAVESQPQKILSAAIDEPGEGTDSALLELKKAIAGNELPEGAVNSPVVQLLMSERANEVSRLMDDFGTRGMNVHPGDSFFIDEKHNLYYQPVGEKPQLFLENADGAVVPHELGGTALPEVPTESPTASPEPVAETAAPVNVPEQDPASSATTQELNMQEMRKLTPEPSIQSGSTPPIEFPPEGTPESLDVDTTGTALREGMRFGDSAAPDASVAAPEIQQLSVPVEGAPQFNQFGADLAKADVYNDANGNLFAHVPADPTKTVEQMSEARFALAQEYMKQHPGTPVSYVDVSKETTMFGFGADRFNVKVVTFMSPDGIGISPVETRIQPLSETEMRPRG